MSIGAMAGSSLFEFAGTQQGVCDKYDALSYERMKQHSAMERQRTAFQEHRVHELHRRMQERIDVDVAKSLGAGHLYVDRKPWLQQYAGMKIRWAGMVGTIVDMQRAGWKFMVDTDDYRHQFRFAMQYGDNGLAWAMDEYMIVNERLKDITIPIGGGPAKVYYETRTPVTPVDWQPFDAEAGVRNIHTLEATYGVGDPPIWDIFEKLFPEPVAYAAREEKQIVVPEEHDVAKLLDMILEQQAPVQAEIRDRSRKREARETRQHASIVTLKEVA